ncbi:hypothetical protein AB1Y20_021197 [Prymnesium parvum]|uniref:tRNA/rRNA methyltransferase SpoU type domain-containing protein n=1 Tax=Prymnesium parvum TaxID=97485 RepID=A0AB34JIW4_PRYPA
MVVVLLLLLLLASPPSAALAPPSEPSVRWRGALRLPAPAAWCDVGPELHASLPPLAFGLCRLRVSRSSHTLALASPEHLALAPAAAVAPHRRAELCLALVDGQLLYPEGSCLALIGEASEAIGEEEGEPHAEELEISIRLEASERMLSSSLFAPEPAIALARVAVRGALLTSGVGHEAIARLEGTDAPSAAKKVYESFLKAAGGSNREDAQLPLQKETLMPAAQRAAHHISHLLREERALQASYLRNTDCAQTAAERCTRTAHPIYIVLDNLRSAYNVGSIFRTADAAHCTEVITCGFTPHPPHPKLSKTGFGAVESVPTRHFSSTLAAVAMLKSQGLKVYCMETTDDAVSYANLDFPLEGMALVLGNEEIGVDVAVMEAADGVIEIPCFGSKNSLNVCSAASIVMFEALRQWGSLTTVSGSASQRTTAGINAPPPE